MEHNGVSENKKMLYATLAGRIYDYIKEQNLKPGHKLPGERKLAMEWQVSRSTLREAIRELENQGVVRVEVGKGTFVTDCLESCQINMHLAMENFLELFEIKTVLERHCVEKTTLRITEEKLDELEALAVQMNEIAQKGVLPLELDHQFHREIMRSYGNHEMTKMVMNMIEMYESFNQQLHRYFRETHFDFQSIMLATFPYHLELLRYMRERNVTKVLKIYDKIVEMDLQVYRKI